MQQFAVNDVKGGKMKRIIWISIKTLLYLLYFIVFLLGLTIAILLICGMKLYCVETGSMEPDYPVGSMVVVERVWFDQLKEGDVITYVVSDNTVVTHRLIGIDTEHQLLTTKGDNSNVADASPVSYKNVIGRVKFGIRGVGYFILILYILRRMYYKSLEEENAPETPPSEEGGEAPQQETADEHLAADQKEELKEERSGTL